MADAWSIPRLWTGLGFSLLTFFAIRGGSDGIMRLTERLVPLMSLGYVVVSVAVLILRAEALPDAFGQILADALHPASAAGGIGGFFLSRGIRY
jgi:AGCS family alanine or glycine:cation symporter